MSKSLLVNKIEGIYLNSEDNYKSCFVSTPIKLTHKDFEIDMQRYIDKQIIYFNKIFISIISKQSVEIEELQQMMQHILELIFVKTGIYFTTVENSENYYMDNQLVFTEDDKKYWFTYENQFFAFKDITEVFDITNWERAVENWINFVKGYALLKDLLLSCIYTNTVIEYYTFQLTVILEGLLNCLVYYDNCNLYKRIEHCIKENDEIKCLFSNNKKIHSFSYKVTNHRNTFAHAKFDSEFYFKGIENEDVIKTLYTIIRRLLIKIINAE